MKALRWLLLLPLVATAQIYYPYTTVPPNGLGVDVRTYGAVCDGVTDDSAAFSTAIAKVNALWAAGTPNTLYIPAGRCFINAAITQFAQGVPARIQGAGKFQSSVVVGAGLTGNLFSWDDAFGNGGTGIPSFNFSVAHNGGSIADVSLFASTTSGAQNAIVCLDRCDNFYLSDVSVWDFNGSALSIGTPNTTTVGFMRESNFYNFTSWHNGSATAPAINISSKTDVGTGNNESTNELKFYGLDLFDSNGVGIAINNQTTGGATKGTRYIQFYGVRIEASRGTYDLVKIGDTTNVGKVNNILFYGLEENTVPATVYGLHIAGTSNNLDSVKVEGGGIFSGPGGGIGIDIGSYIELRDIYFDSALSTALTVGSSANIGCCVRVEGVTGYPTTSIDPTSSANVIFGGGQTPSTGAPWKVDVLGNGTFKALVGTTLGTEPTAGSIGEVVSLDCPVTAAGAAATAVSTPTASPGVVTWTAHTFTPSAALANYTCPINFTGAVPTGVTVGTTYFIIGSSVSGDAFQISDTAAHALAGTNAVNFTGGGVAPSAYIGAAGTDSNTFVGAALNLVAGDFDCNAVGEFQETSAITSTRIVSGINTGAGVGAIGTFTDIRGSIGNNNLHSPTPISRQNNSATTGVYVVDNLSFTVGTANEGGFLRCRRMR